MLGERLDLGQAIGAALIVLAVLAATMGGKAAH
jgi:drug/metabolite transporter (DMT)-like permease